MITPEERRILEKIEDILASEVFDCDSVAEIAELAGQLPAKFAATRASFSGALGNLVSRAENVTDLKEKLKAAEELEKRASGRA